MTATLSGSLLTNLQWEAVGAWQDGTVVSVVLAGTGDTARGLLASRAGAYGWAQPAGTVAPLVQDLSDLDVVAVAFAGGNGTEITALAATATGRLYRMTASTVALAAPEWQEVNAWAGLGVAVVLAPSPNFAEDQTLFVGTPSGFFRTLDSGQSWESCNFGLLDEEALCMVCAPNFAESELLWAGTAGGGLYRSRNSARAWRESGLGLPDAAVQSLAVSPNFAEDRALFAGMEEHGVYVSRDGGENWAPLALADHSVNTLVCSTADRVWAGTEDGLWRISTSSGESVQVMGAGETVMSVAATEEGQLAVGLFGSGLWLTADGRGEPSAIQWQKPAVALHAPPVVAHANQNLFALDADGLMAHSQESGAQWHEVDSSNVDVVFALDAAPLSVKDGSGGATLFAATASGIARWDEPARTWTEVAADTFAEHTALGIELSPDFADDQTMLVVSHDSTLFISQDNGASWREITGPWRGQSLLHAHFAPTRAREVVALTVQPNETGHFNVAAWHSADLGQTWDVLAGLTSGVPAVSMAWPHDKAENAIFLATQHRVIKLYHHADPATLQVHQHFFDEALRVTALTVAPDYFESKTVWAATTAGLYRSVDTGMSWGMMLELPNELPVVWLEMTATHIHAITLGGHVWRAALGRLTAMTESFDYLIQSAGNEITAIGLRSESVEIVVLPEVGAKVYSLKNLRSGREWMWTPPEGATFEPVSLRTPFEESSLVGADECLPTIAASQWRGRSIPSHGEVWSAVWEVDRLALTQGRIVTRLELPISPFWVERTIRLDGSKVVFDYALRNLDFAPQEFMWAFHPLMNIVEGDRLELPGISHILTEASIGVPLGGRGDVIPWPYPTDGVALNHLDFGRPNAAVKLFTEERAASSATIYNERTGDGLRFDFDPRRVDTLGIWLTRGGWNGYDHLAVEPGIGAPDPLDVAVEGWKRFALVMPDQTYRWQFTLSLSPVERVV